MLDFLVDIDTKLFLFFNGLHNHFFDYFMMAFTGRFNWIPMYVVIFFMIYLRFNWRVASVYVVATGLAILMTDQLCATVIRPVVERLRPANIENPLSEFVHIFRGYRGGTYGFPSCHAANSFCLAILLSLLISERRFSIVIFTWAFFHSYSRLYLGVHYPGDLIVGAILGGSVSLLFYVLLKCIVANILPAELQLRQVDEKIRLGRIVYTCKVSDMVFVAFLLTTIVMFAYALIKWI